MNKLIAIVLMLMFTLMMQISVDFYISTTMKADVLETSTYYSFLNEYNQFGLIPTSLMIFFFLASLYFFFIKKESILPETAENKKESEQG